MLRRMLLTGLISGILAGSAATVLQQVRVIPLILEAETYEHASAAQGAEKHVSVQQTKNTQPLVGGQPPESLVGGQPPARFFYTWVANTVTGMGFAFLLAGAFGLHGRAMSPLRGLLWGLAGFAAFAAAPAIGLPPEPPGVPVAGVLERQVWWLATVAATVAGLALLVLQRHPMLMVLGALLLVAPHLLGVPQADSAASSLLPPGLAHEFVLASLLTTAAFWLILGGFSGWMFRRLE